jgi:endonuclease YncB( thermonuclease family)
MASSVLFLVATLLLVALVRNLWRSSLAALRVITRRGRPAPGNGIARNGEAVSNGGAAIKFAAAARSGTAPSSGIAPISGVAFTTRASRSGLCHATDGATVVFAQRRYALSGIATPRAGDQVLIGHAKIRQHDAGALARAHLAQIIGEDEVKIIATPPLKTAKPDGDGRERVLLFCKGRDAGLKMLADGYATALPGAPRAYLKAMESARRHSRGLWGAQATTAPAKSAGRRPKAALGR